MSPLQVFLVVVPAIAPGRLFSTALLCEAKQITVRSSFFLLFASFLCALDTLIVRQVALDFLNECVAIDLIAVAVTLAYTPHENPVGVVRNGRGMVDRCAIRKASDRLTLRLDVVRPGSGVGLAGVR